MSLLSPESREFCSHKSRRKFDEYQASLIHMDEIFMGTSGSGSCDLAWVTEFSLLSATVPVTVTVSGGPVTNLPRLGLGGFPVTIVLLTRLKNTELALTSPRGEAQTLAEII